jgi:large subunit ribosomal protein L17
LIEHHRIKTTLAKAKAVRPFAEKLVTLGKKKSLHARRTALARLRHNETAVKRLFDEVAPRAAARQGGYTRIIKLGQRRSDAAPMAYIEWVDGAGAEVEAAQVDAEKKSAKSKPARKKESAGKAESAAKAESKAKEKTAPEKKTGPKRKKAPKEKK